GLLDEPLVAVLAADSFDDLGDDRPLLVGVEVFGDRRLGDVPVGADAIAELMIEREADRYLLFVRQRGKQPADGGFGIAAGTRGGIQPRSEGEQRTGGTGLQKTSAGNVETAVRAIVGALGAGGHD